MNTSLAMLPSLLGTITGAWCSYVIYKNTIAKWYGASGKNSSVKKVQYYLGVVSCLSIAIGLMDIANEIFFVIFNGGNIRENVIFKALYPALAFPAIFAIFGYLTVFFFANKKEKTILSYEIRAMDLANENFYAEALDEIKNQKQRPGLWAIALAKNQGDINLATANYISQRVSELTQKSSSDIHFKTPDKNSNFSKYIIFMVIGAFSLWLYFITMRSGSDNELGNFFRELFNITKKS